VDRLLAKEDRKNMIFFLFQLIIISLVLF